MIRPLVVSITSTLAGSGVRQSEAAGGSAGGAGGFLASAGRPIRSAPHAAAKAALFIAERLARGPDEGKAAKRAIAGRALVGASSLGEQPARHAGRDERGHVA